MSRREKIIIFAVAAVCLVCSVIFVFIPKKSGSYAVISLNGETVMKKSLSDEGTFTVPQIPNMEFEIADGGVRVKSSDCPDKICVKTGLVSHEGMSAVCMPNRVIVTVEGTDEK